jgi:hypothetical protein
MILPPDDKKEVEPEAPASSSLPRNPDIGANSNAHSSSAIRISTIREPPEASNSALDDGITTPDGPTEETRLLPPPSYSEAVSQSGKAGKSRRLRFLAIGLFVVLFASVVVGITAAQRKFREERSRGWKRGGLDGKGEHKQYQQMVDS